MDSDRAPASSSAAAAASAGSRRAFQSALDHLFAETERQLQTDAQQADAMDSGKDSARRAARATSGSSSRARREAASAAAAAAPVTGSLFLDSDALDDDDDGSLGEAEAEAARLAHAAVPSPRHAFGADTQRSSSGRHTARNGGSGDLSSRRRAASSGRTGSTGSSSLYTSAGEGGYDTFSRPLPMSFAPVAYAAGPSHHEMELLQRLEHVRSSVEHYRQSSELAGRVLDTKVRSQLQSLVSKLNVQLRELEERLNSHYATSANISLNHTLEFRRKIKSDLKQFKAQMESWCAGETARLQAIEAKVNQQQAAGGNAPRSSAAPAATTSVTATPAPIQALQLQQQLLADRQELVSLKLQMEQSALRDAAREKAHREEMDELRAEMRRMAQGIGSGSAVPVRTLAAPLSTAAASSPASPNNAGPPSARGSEAPTRSEFQHLQSLFHRLEHSHNTQAVEFTHLQQSHERHLELVAQSQTKATQSLEQDVQQLGQHLTALQNQVDDGAAAAAAAAAATASPSARQRAGPKSPPQQSRCEGRGTSAASGNDVAADTEELRSRLASLQAEMDQHRRLFDAVGAELKDHTERLSQLDQAQSAAAAATSAAATGHAEQHKVAELLSSTLSTLDEQVVELADKVLALEEAAAVKPAAADSSASDDSSRAAAQQSQHDRLLSRVTELDAEVHSLSARLSETEALPAAVESLRSSQSVILAELERQSGAHLDRSAARTATVAEIAAQVTALEEKVAALTATVDKLNNQSQPYILEELHDTMDRARALDDRVAALEGNVSALSPSSGGGANLPPALRPVLESLQHQLDNLAHRSEDSEAYFNNELEQQRMMLLRHGEILHSLDDGQITEEDDQGEAGEDSSIGPSSGRARPPSPPSRAQLQWQRKQAALAREAAGSENLDEVSMDFPATAPGALSVHIPQTRPGSSQSVLSTRSVHPVVDGFDSRPATAQVEQEQPEVAEEEEAAPAADASAAAAAPAHADLFGSPRAVMPRKGAKGKSAAAGKDEDSTASATASSRSSTSVSHSASSTPSSSKPLSSSTTGNTTPPAAAVTSASKSKRESPLRPLSPESDEADYEYDPDFINASPSPSPLPESKKQPVAADESEKGAAAASSSPAKKTLDFGAAAPAASSSSSSATSAPAATIASAPAPSAAPSTFRPSNSATCHTAAEFAQLREELRAYGIDRVQSDQLALGWLSRDASSGAVKIAADPKPFNPFARLVSGALAAPYGNLLESAGITDPAVSRFMVARNRPELDAAWNDGSAEMLGKASMARRHEFMLLRDLTQWEHFNAATFGIRGDAASLTEGIQLLDDLSRVAHAYAAKSGWSSQLGLFVHVYPFNSVHALHVHMLDLETTGPTFHHLAHKNLPLTDVRQVLLDELRAVDADAAERMANPDSAQKQAASHAEEEDEISEVFEEEEEPEQQEEDSDAEEEATRSAPTKRTAIGAAAEASARAALRSELDGKRLELMISCGELPINCCAVLLSEKPAAADGDGAASSPSAASADSEGFVKRGWTESQNGQTNPSFETPLFLTYHAGECLEQSSASVAVGQTQQEIRLELFDTSSVSRGSRPVLVASVHVLLEEIAFALGHELSFPFSGFPHDMPVALDQTPHVNIKATLALQQQGEERVMRTPVASAVGREEQEESKDAAIDSAGSKPNSPSASKSASASAAPAAASASVASPARSISTAAPVVMLNLRATNLPSAVASVALFVQDATLSPARVSRSETQPPTEFTFVCHASTAPIPHDLPESEEVPFSPGLAFVYSRGHILKLNLYAVSNPSRGLVDDDEARLGSVFIRQDDLYESAMESASLRAAQSSSGRGDEEEEEEAAELTFFFNHEQPEKNEALEEIELIVESRLVPAETMQLQQQQQEAAAASSPTAHASGTVTRSSESDLPPASSFTHTVSVSISCRGLPLSKPSGICDPIAAAFIHAAEGDGFEYVSQTEWLRDTRDPTFEDQIQLEHCPFEGQLVKFSVYDVSSESVSDDERIGSVLVKMDDLFQTMPESGSGAGGDGSSNLDTTFNTAVRRSPEALARALVEGVGNEMIYELLHENPEKQARLKGATICIAYTATSLQGGQRSAAASRFEDSPSESEDHHHQQQSGLRTPPSARRRAGAADEEEGDESPLEDLDAESEHPYSSSDLGAQRDDPSSSYANSTLNRSNAGIGGGGLHRQSHNDNLEAVRRSRPTSQAATPTNNLSPFAASSSAAAKSSVYSPSSSAAPSASATVSGFGGASSIPTASKKVSAAAASMGIGALLSNIARGEFDDDDDDHDDDGDEGGDEEARGSWEDEGFSDDARPHPTARYASRGSSKPAAASQLSPSVSGRFGAPAAAAALPSSYYEGDDIEEDLDIETEENPDDGED